VELSDGTTGEAIAVKLLESLSSLGFNAAVLQRRLIGFCTDGASNLHGCVKGALNIIGIRLDRNDIVTFHCMNHKLELAVHDVVNSINRVTHLRMFMDTLYSYYSRSPNNCRHLAAASHELQVELKKIGKIFDVRWLSSSYKSVNATYQSLPALVRQLNVASIDPSSNAKDRAKALGMAKKVQSFEFLLEIALMRDALEILQNLSLFLQKRDSSIITANDNIQVALRSLDALKTVNSITMTEVTNQCCSGHFRGYAVTKKDSDLSNFAQMRAQFLQALIDNIRSRFPQQVLLEAGGILSPVSWPSDEDQKAVFGDQHVLTLAKLCKVDGRAALNDFRLYKYNQSIGEDLSMLLKRVKVIPVSSAECERGFSCMNIADIPLRNRLRVESLSALLFIKINGPQPSHFKPVPYVTKWLQEGHHASQDTLTRPEKTCTKPESAFSCLF
jgi:hypothetical protein